MGRTERNAHETEPSDERHPARERARNMVVTMGDPDTALAAIKAAGDDFQSLYEAMKKAEEDAKKGIVTKNYDVNKYWPQLKETWEGLRWRLKAMPGGSTKKPDTFYDLYGYF